jgi:hypothetical protein
MGMKIKLSDWVDIFLAWPVMVYRLLKYGYTYRRIYLGEGQWTILDQEDYCRLRDYKWFVYGTGHNFVRGSIQISQSEKDIVCFYAQGDNER